MIGWWCDFVGDADGVDVLAVDWVRFLGGNVAGASSLNVLQRRSDPIRFHPVKTVGFIVNASG